MRVCEILEGGVWGVRGKHNGGYLKKGGGRTSTSAPAQNKDSHTKALPPPSLSVAIKKKNVALPPSLSALAEHAIAAGKVPEAVVEAGCSL